MRFLILSILSLVLFSLPVRAQVPSSVYPWESRIGAVCSSITNGTDHTLCLDSVTNELYKCRSSDGTCPTLVSASNTYSDSLLNTSGNVALVNDVVSPGNSYCYSTNSSGIRGWYACSAFSNMYQDSNGNIGIGMVGPYTYEFNLATTGNPLTFNYGTGTLTVPGSLYSTGIGGYLQFPEVAVPNTPNSGYDTLFFESNHLPYYVNYLGVVTPMAPLVNGPSGGISYSGFFSYYSRYPIEENVINLTSVTPSGNYEVTYQNNTEGAGNLTINAPVATGIEGQPWILKITSTSVQTFVWNSIYTAGTGSLPTATTGGSKSDYFNFKYDSIASKWDFTGANYGY